MRPFGSGRIQLADEVWIQFSGASLPFLAGKNLRPEFLAQPVAFFCGLRGGKDLASRAKVQKHLPGRHRTCSPGISARSRDEWDYLH